MCVISVIPKTKKYKCRCEKISLGWEYIKTSCPSRAAVILSERLDLEEEDVITVWGVGKFEISFTKDYRAELQEKIYGKT